MRLHNRFSYLWPCYNAEFVSAMLSEENLFAARFEPVYSQRYEAFIDLSFERNGEWMIVPMLRADGVSIMVPENPPLTWPASYERFDCAELRRVEDRINPWLQSLTTARLVNDAAVRYFRDSNEVRANFEYARSRGWIGSAPYADVLRSIGPAAYGLRFARGRQVALSGSTAVNAAAVLSSVDSKIDADFPQNDASAARSWLAGLTLKQIDTSKRYDLYVGPRAEQLKAPYCIFTDGDVELGERKVQVAEPIPADVMLSFDLEDGPLAMTFAVTETKLDARRVSLNPRAALGGSSGCVRLVVRDDGARFGDADTDAAEVLASELRTEGIDAEVTIASRVDVTKTDVIHVFGLRHGASLVELLRDAEPAGVPIIVTPYADDRRGEAISGPSGTLLIPRTTNDTVAFDDYTWAFARRRITNLSQGDWYDDVAKVLLARASCAIVTAPAEADFLREKLGYRGVSIPVPAMPSLAAPNESIGSVVGPDEFVLLHGPIEPRMNQLFTAVAAQREGLPLMVFGPVADIEFYRYVNEVAGPGVIMLRDDALSENEIAAIYGRARVVVDPSWSSRGLHRLARGAATGAAIVASSNAYAHEVWGDLVRTVDPADVDGIAMALRGAWEQQPRIAHALRARTAEKCDPYAVLVATVSAYQQASAVPA